MSNYYTFKPTGTYEVILQMDGDSILSFHQDPANTDYQQYLAWLEEGNVPEEWNPEVVQ